MSTVIRAENIRKRYFLNQTVGHSLRRFTASLVGKSIPDKEEFWALDGVNFTVEKGESVGLIGANGAGKSTLLKVLSNVTKPTVGRLDVQGRVGALIEVGAGFHPELTGRENIYLNGSILGLKRREIRDKFDDIVAFSELERFIDTPVKRYSSGMFVRLGFSVAAHIYPDILLIDEILAVGDHRFQKKCFEWIRTFLQSDQTFFLVSHNMHHIESVCTRVLYVKKGRVAFDGSPQEAISRYMVDLNSIDRKGGEALPGRKVKADDLDIFDIGFLNAAGKEVQSVGVEEPLLIRLRYRAPTRVVMPKVEFAFNSEGMRIGQTNTISDRAAPEYIEGEGEVIFEWGKCSLTPNRYSLDVFVSDGKTAADLISWEGACNLDVIVPPGFQIASGRPGLCKFSGEWKFNNVS